MIDPRHKELWFWGIIGFTVILVAGLALAGSLYQTSVNERIERSTQEACLAERQLQVEHNELVAALKFALRDTAATRRALADTVLVPESARINRAAAERFEELAESVHTVPVTRCPRG